MKGAARAFLGLEPEKPIKKTDPVQFGLNYPAEEYVLDRWHTWQKSGETVYPNGQGRDSQSPTLIEDFKALNVEFMYWIAYYKKQRDGQGNTSTNRTVARQAGQ